MLCPPLCHSILAHCLMCSGPNWIIAIPRRAAASRDSLQEILIYVKSMAMMAVCPAKPAWHACLLQMTCWRCWSGARPGSGRAASWSSRRMSAGLALSWTRSVQRPPCCGCSRISLSCRRPGSMLMGQRACWNFERLLPQTVRLSANWQCRLGVRPCRACDGGCWRPQHCLKRAVNS